jgi:uncharacterized protein (TIGR02284 family)
MAEIGEHLKDETLKRYFLAESLKRASFRGELENELHRHGVHDVHETGTAAGAVYRAWGELKAKLGGGDHTLLVTAEEGEDEAKDGIQGCAGPGASDADPAAVDGAADAYSDVARFCSRDTGMR